MRELEPQIFDEDSETLIPKSDFYTESLSKISNVYVAAENFCFALKSIMGRKQYFYDIIRSLSNIYNLNNSDVFTPSTPTGIYLEMLASNTGTNFTLGQSETIILNKIRNQITFINSRGQFDDFVKYLNENGFANSISNDTLKETGNSTIKIRLPIGSNEQLTQIKYDLFRVKTAGVSLEISTETPPIFAFSTTVSGILSAPQPRERKGWSTINSRGIIVGGGLFSATLP